MRRILPLIAVLVLAAGISVAPRHLVSNPQLGQDFVHFESQQVHPVTLTPDGTRLVVCNTPDGYVTVFSLTGDEPVKIAEIPVGLEPVSVACPDDSTAWVVNFVSDDISIVNLNLAHTVNTLRVGDGPADVVFANGNAYVSVSEQDLVRVFDPVTLAEAASPIPINGRLPKALARSADGSKVFVGVLMAGNRTSQVPAALMPPDSMPADPDLPMDPGLPPAPHRGLIVQQVGGTWYDMYGNVWNSKLKFSMPDVDVAEISTASNAVSRNFSGVGSTIFNLAVSPTDGRLAVAAAEARNVLLFEPRLSGYLTETNLVTITTAGAIAIKKFDPHIDYETLPGTQAEADSAIGFPSGIVYGPDGSRAYVTSLATNKVAVMNPNNGAFSAVLARIPSVAGPTGIAMDNARHRIYVLGRFKNLLQTISTDSLKQVAVTRIGMDPTPDAIVNGRRFFYGGFTSAHGDQSCATCHVFGDMDGLAWDLGDPLGSYVPPPASNPLGLSGFHPMKGPMATQTLRGMTNTEPLHWRGDRANLSAFNGAFVSLMGRNTTLPDSQMAAFNAFTMPLTMSPNPRQNLDRTFVDAPMGAPSAARGRAFFLSTPVLNGKTCEDCHAETNHGPGTNRQMVHRDSIFEAQDLKVPQLRNLYRKGGFNNAVGASSKRGYGYSHDGSVSRPADFLKRSQFTFDPDSATADQERADMESYLLAFDTGMSPAVGRQMTFTGPNNADTDLLGTLDSLKSAVGASDCDLIARGRINGQPRGWVYEGGDLWTPDKVAESSISTAALVALGGAGSEVTISGVPFGNGHRMGIDRDDDTYLNGDELDAGSDPGNPLHNPTNVGVPPGGSGTGAAFALRHVAPNPFRAFTEVSFTMARAGRVSMSVYDVLGREVRPVARGQWFEAGPAALRWDGRNADGASAPAGVYFVRVRIPEAGVQWTRPVVRIR